MTVSGATRPFLRKQHLGTDRAAIGRLSTRNQAGTTLSFSPQLAIFAGIMRLRSLGKTALRLSSGG
jgi:hypothetical protein